MDGFTIGEKIIVDATAKTDYKDKRKIWFPVRCEPREAWYVGYTWKQEGDYVEPDFYDEVAHLTNIKSVKLLRVKFVEWGNDYFAFRQYVRRIR